MLPWFLACNGKGIGLANGELRPFQPDRFSGMFQRVYTDATCGEQIEYDQPQSIMRSQAVHGRDVQLQMFVRVPGQALHQEAGEEFDTE